MNSAERSDLSAFSLSRIAMAIEDQLAHLDENYKKPLFAEIGSQWRSLLIKLGRRPKNRKRVLKEPERKCPPHKYGAAHERDISPHREPTPERGQSVKNISSIYPVVNVYDKAEETSSSIDAYWCECGLGLSEMGQFEDALASYDKALKINPNSFKALKNRANVLYRIGRYEEAASDFENALLVNPGLIDAWQGLGNALSKLG
ncbi:MAG: hypothetical protein CG446_1059, partial [Methanosaeta sp. ASO1]